MFVLSLLAAIALTSQEPQPLPPIPTPRQLAWHKLERYCFVHFGPNTFTGEEWGTGKEPAEIFNPKKLDCRQWCKVFKAAGFKGVMITAKHHDGFCLWPSKYSTHTVAQSPWKKGRGDVLKELSQACKESGLKFGVYLSPWDRNHPAYGSEAYNEVFKSMLREVLTHYGPVFEVWFDGANGEGPNGKRQVYDWPGFVKVVRECQPNAVIFSDAGPDIRWVGNEDGYAGETNWGMIDRSKFAPGVADQKILNTGDEFGPDWVPSECDVSIRPGWFWRAGEDSKLKTVDKLMDIWRGSVGRGSNLLLNVPPNSDGLISQVDADRLAEFDRAIRSETAHEVKASSMVALLGDTDQSGSAGPAWRLANVADGKPDTFYMPPAPFRSVNLQFEFHNRPKIRNLAVSEYLPLGQRVRQFKVVVHHENRDEVFSRTTIGNLRMLKLSGEPVVWIELHLLDWRDRPAISAVRFYADSQD